MKRLLYVLALLPSVALASSRLSGLSETTTPSTTDYTYVVTNSTSMKMQLGTLLNLPGASTSYILATTSPTFVSYSSASVSYLGISSGSASADTLTKSSAAVSYLGISSGTSSVAKFSKVVDPVSVRLSSDSCVISNSTNALTASLLCDDSSEEYVFYATVLYPYSAGGLTFDVNYSMLSATSGDVTFWAQEMCESPGDAADLDAESFTTRVSSTVTVAGTAGYPRKARIQLNDDSCASGDQLIIKFGRAGEQAGDTATGDTEIRPSLLYEP